MSKWKQEKKVEKYLVLHMNQKCNNCKPIELPVRRLTLYYCLTISVFKLQFDSNKYLDRDESFRRAVTDSVSLQKLLFFFRFRWTQRWPESSSNFLFLKENLRLRKIGKLNPSSKDYLFSSSSPFEQWPLNFIHNKRVISVTSRAHKGLKITKYALQIVISLFYLHTYTY